MKNRKTLKIFIFLFVLSIGFREAYFSFDKIKEEKIENENQSKVEAFSEHGLSYPLPGHDEDTNILEVRSIHKYELDSMKDLTECDNLHMDIYKSDVEEFLDSKVGGWNPGNWTKTDTRYWVVEYEDGTRSYRNELEYYSSINTQTKFFVRIEIDAVSERVHNIHYYLPYEENSKKAYTDTLTWLGIENSESENIYTKMMDAIYKMEDNKRIAYDTYGYQLFISEQEFSGNGEVDNAYSMSIVPNHKY